jgi:hypothetical protein
MMVDKSPKPLALASILMRVRPLRREIGVLKAPWATGTRFPATRTAEFSGATVPSTSILDTATLAPSVGAVSDTRTLLGVDAVPQPATSAHPVQGRTASNARQRATPQT